MKAILISSNNSAINPNIASGENDIQFESIFEFNSSLNELDEKFSLELLHKLCQIDFDIVFISDNLSNNPIDFSGINLACHIRLSQELGDKRYCPIILLSDLDLSSVIKLAPLNSIFLTSRVILAKDSYSSYSFFKKNLNKFAPLNQSNFKANFLEKIDIPMPKNHEDYHSITNEWSIAKWSKAIDAKSELLDINTAKIEQSLYFKFQKAINNIKQDNKKGLTKTSKFTLKTNGKILYIDDEYNKGWEDIFLKYFLGHNLGEFEFRFECFKNFDKDDTADVLAKKVMNKVTNYDPDLVIIDFRLTKNDFDDIEFSDRSIVKIINFIKKINPGIQILVLSATSKSSHLKDLQKLDIVGYIKKESPQDRMIDTYDNIAEFGKLVNVALSNKYLKEIYNLQNDIKKHSAKFSDETINKQIEFLFEVLNLKSEKKFELATILILYSCFESITRYYMEEIDGSVVFRNDVLLDSNFKKKKFECGQKDRIWLIVEKFISRKSLKKPENLDNDIRDFFDARNSLAHTNNEKISINSNHILKWSKALLEITKIIEPRSWIKI